MLHADRWHNGVLFVRVEIFSGFVHPRWLISLRARGRIMVRSWDQKYGYLEKVNAWRNAGCRCHMLIDKLGVGILLLVPDELTNPVGMLLHNVMFDEARGLLLTIVSLQDEIDA